MKQAEAWQALASAISSGKLVPSEQCELCGAKQTHDHDAIRGHHWHGYDYPLEVWWVCRTCNARLINRHDGSLTVEEAKLIVVKKEPANGHNNPVMTFRMPKDIRVRLDTFSKSEGRTTSNAIIYILNRYLPQ